MKIYNSPLDLIGNTPLLRLQDLENKYQLSSHLYAKLEKYNMFSSVKDRIAKAMIEDGLSKEIINSDTTIIEPTSGNTGIALSAICAIMKIKLILVMPESMSIERRKLMLAYGAELILTSANEGMKGAIEKANELHKRITNSIILDQFSNEANRNIHYQTTGPEIYQDLDGKIDYFIAGIGTGGTISGVGKYLKEINKNIKVIGVEPLQSPFLSFCTKGPHKIQGIGAGFKPDILDLSVVDEIVTVDENEAITLFKILSQEEGLLIGISSCAALCVALNIAKKEKDKNIVVIFPDSGERYLSMNF